MTKRTQRRGATDELPPIPDKRYFHYQRSRVFVECEKLCVTLLGTRVSQSQSRVNTRGNRRFYQKSKMYYLCDKSENCYMRMDLR